LIFASFWKYYSHSLLSGLF